ncbi:C-C motif chemokine 19-like [Carettochelys insculpta]|uniref:C-C motif chemokine 19-like n=1 Tax=Carettochelys insculpta TaxID=44489 RepID=UPI003EBCD5F6
MELARNLAFLCLVILSLCLLLPVSSTNDALDCCLRTSSVPIPGKILRDYKVQRRRDGCPIPAVVFVTLRGRRLCAPPHAPWVLRLAERLEHLHQHKDSRWHK